MHRCCVIIIITGSIVILLASLIFRFFFMPDYQRKGTSQMIYVIEIAMDEYKEDYGNYPEEKNGALANILLGDNSREKRYLHQGSIFLRNGLMTDLWKHPLQINVEEGTLAIISAGRNRQFGDADDLTSQLARERHRIQEKKDSN